MNLHFLLETQAYLQGLVIDKLIRGISNNNIDRRPFQPANKSISSLTRPIKLDNTPMPAAIIKALVKVVLALISFSSAFFIAFDISTNCAKI